MDKIDFSINANELAQLFDRVKASSAVLRKAVEEQPQQVVDAKQRSPIGDLHKALELNYYLQDGSDIQKIQDALKIMHNAAIRLVSFIDEVIKQKAHIEYPESKTKDYTFRRDIKNANKYYEVKLKTGQSISIEVNYDEDTGVICDYEIHYLDSDRQRTETSDTEGLTSEDESLRFHWTLPNHNTFKELMQLEIQRPYSVNQSKSGDDFLQNLQSSISAGEDAVTTIDLLKLDIDGSFMQELSDLIKQF